MWRGWPGSSARRSATWSSTSPSRRRRPCGGFKRSASCGCGGPGTQPRTDRPRRPRGPRCTLRAVPRPAGPGLRDDGSAHAPGGAPDQSHLYLDSESARLARLRERCRLCDQLSEQGPARRGQQRGGRAEAAASVSTWLRSVQETGAAKRGSASTWQTSCRRRQTCGFTSSTSAMGCCTLRFPACRRRPHGSTH